jgi:hypothetical protein
MTDVASSHRSLSFKTFLGVVRPEWLPWLAPGGLAGIRTDGEIFRITWECLKWIGELYRVAITGDIPLVFIEAGNSVQMIKRCYWDVKQFDEGLRWFGLTFPIPVERRRSS